MAFQNGWRGPDIVSDGLVLYLDAGSPNSYRTDFGITWKDMSGFNNSGSLINGPVYNSANGGSIAFDGVNDFAQISNTNLLNPTLSMTLSAWINITSFVSLMSIFGKGEGNSGYDFRIDSSNSLNLVKYAVGDQTTGISSLSTNTWYNIVAVQSSTRVDYYVNGSNAGSFSDSRAYITNAVDIRIARNRGDIYTPARIQQILFYNRVLSAAEVLQNFNAIKSRFGL